MRIESEHGGFSEDGGGAFTGYETETFVITAANPVAREAIERFARLLPDMVEEKRRSLSEDRISALLDVLMPDDPIGAARHELEIDNAKLRARFLAENDCYTSAQLSDMAGHGAKNRSVTASRWKAEGRIFSVPFKRAELYPAFQFREGQPNPAVAAILASLPASMTAWQKAFWFVSPNGWLGGAKPAERLGEAAEVAAAAAREGQIIG